MGRRREEELSSRGKPKGGSSKIGLTMSDDRHISDLLRRRYQDQQELASSEERRAREIEEGKLSSSPARRRAPVRLSG